MTALTAAELIAWNDRTAQGWRSLVEQHPEVLSFPCDVRETNTVSELLQHIVAVELRYAQRLQGVDESPYDEVPSNTAQRIFAVHEQAMALINKLVAEQQPSWWEVPIQFATRSAGTVQATRRTVLVHTLMHSVRHYAQLATLVRQRGISPGWPMDYLYMGASPLA